MSIAKFNTSATPPASSSSNTGIIAFFVLAIAAVGAYFYFSKDKEDAKSNADSQDEPE